MPIINIIVAVDRNRAIGYQGDQLAYISQDLKHFKSTTMGKPVIMGRRTNEALPKRKLPGRRNIVITRHPSFSVEGVDVAHSVDEAIRMVADEPEVFVIGGAQIYETFLPVADKLYVTVIDHVFPYADTFFPDFSDWNVIDASEPFTDEKSGLKFKFMVLKRE